MSKNANEINKELENTLKLEKSFLGGVFCLNNKEEFNGLLDIVKSKDFFDIKHQEIFKAMEKKFELGKKNKRDMTEENSVNNNIDVITFDYDAIVDEVLKSNKKINEHEFRVYLLELLESNFFSYDLKDKANLIVEKSKLRELDDLGKKISKLSNEVSLTSDEVIDEVESLLEKITRKAPPQTIVDIRQLAIKNFKILDEAEELGVAGNISNTGYKVGFSVIDDKINGLSKSDLIIIAGRPSMGKTAFALNVILKFCEVNNDLHTLFYSLEMPPDQLYYRFVAMESEIPITDLKYKSNLMSEEIKDKYMHGIMNVAMKNIHIADTPTLNLYELKKLAYKQKDSTGLDLIVIDYLQLLANDRSNGKYAQMNRQQEISDISRGLKQLARELNIPIIALSQLSRSVESRSDKRPMLSDLRESGAIEQDADIVMFLYRDEYYNPNSSDLGLAEIIVAKQRNGAIGTVKMKFDNACTKFSNFIDYHHN